MTYGIVVKNDDGFVQFSSDHSSIVYAGELYTRNSPVRPVYDGEKSVAIGATQKSNNYDLGWQVQYVFALNTSYMIPFYKPAFNGQRVGIVDLVNEGEQWVVNMIYDGMSTQKPRVFAFAPLNELPTPPRNVDGLVIYDGDGKVVYNDAQLPLKVDSVVPITHPAKPRVASPGYCSSGSCHLNYMVDQATVHTSEDLNWNTTIYSIIPSAYAGLADQFSGSGTSSCGFLGLGSRPYAWGYQSWCSYRGVMQHDRLTDRHYATYLGDSAGALYDRVEGSCGLPLWLGAILGALAVIVTGGAALAIVAGAVTGFYVATFFQSTIPAMRAYERDETFDQNNTVNMLMTDLIYYAVDNPEGEEYDEYFRCGGYPFEDGTDFYHDGLDYVWRYSYFNDVRPNWSVSQYHNIASGFNPTYYLDPETFSWDQEQLEEPMPEFELGNLDDGDGINFYAGPLIVRNPFYTTLNGEITGIAQYLSVPFWSQETGEIVHYTNLYRTYLGYEFPPDDTLYVVYDGKVLDVSGQAPDVTSLTYWINNCVYTYYKGEFVTQEDFLINVGTYETTGGGEPGDPYYIEYEDLSNDWNNNWAYWSVAEYKVSRARLYNIV